MLTRYPIGSPVIPFGSGLLVPKRPSGLDRRVHHMGRPVPQQHRGSVLGATFLGFAGGFDRATCTVRRGDDVVHGQQGVLRRRG